MKPGFLREALGWTCFFAVAFGLMVWQSFSDASFRPRGGPIPILVAAALMAIIGGPIAAFWFRFLRSWRNGNSKPR